MNACERCGYDPESETEASASRLAMTRAYWQDMVDRGLISQEQADKNVASFRARRENYHLEVAGETAVSTWKWRRVLASATRSDVDWAVDQYELRAEEVEEPLAVLFAFQPLTPTALRGIVHPVPARPHWQPLQVAEQASWSLSVGSDEKAEALAWLTPLGHGDRSAWAGIQLPTLEDGPIRLVFPPIPDELPARPVSD